MNLPPRYPVKRVSLADELDESSCRGSEDETNRDFRGAAKIQPL